jgi:uncharacterized protein YuzE
MRDENNIEIDETADTAYLRLSAIPVAQTREVAPGVMVDFDAKEQIVGVEVLGLRQRVGDGDPASYLRGLVAGLKLQLLGIAAE